MQEWQALILERYVTFEGSCKNLRGFFLKKAGVTFKQILIFSKMNTGEVTDGIMAFLFAWIFFFSPQFLSGEYLYFSPCLISSACPCVVSSICRMGKL